MIYLDQPGMSLQIFQFRAGTGLIIILFKALSSNRGYVRSQTLYQDVMYLMMKNTKYSKLVKGEMWTWTTISY